MTITMKNKKGFTLTELIIVMAVIAILAAVMIPSLVGYVNRARQSSHDQEAAIVANELNNYIVGLMAGTEETPVEFKTGFGAYYTEITGETLAADVEIHVDNDTTPTKISILLEEGREPYTASLPANLDTSTIDLLVAAYPAA